MEENDLEKKYLALTKENLYQKYIIENTRLFDMPEFFGVSINKIRAKLSAFNIKKDKKLIYENIDNFYKKQYGISYSEFAKINLVQTPDQRKASQLKATEAKLKNSIERDAKLGITYESLYQLYIIENRTLVEVAKIFNTNKSNIRKILKRHKVPPKDPIKAQETRTKSIRANHKDPKKGKLIQEKTRLTMLARYGNNWYYNNSSKLEMEVLMVVKNFLPGEEIIQGDYSVIRREEGSGREMQLDIFIPKRNKAIEVNGNYWHDRKTYELDLVNNTEFSREALKTRLCVNKGIELLHIWENDWNQNKDKEINKIETFLEQVIEF